MSIAKPRKVPEPKPVNEAPVDRAVCAIATLAGLLRHEVDRATVDSGMSQPMALALGRLTKMPEQTTVGALARSIGCNMGNLSGTLDRLQEAGCIERIVGEADRRARFIRVTAKGRKIAAQISARFRRGHLRSVLEQMNVRQLEELADAIEALNDEVSDRYQGVDQPNTASRTTDLI
jgi:MarR family transcriptional regulator, transcriptional regulator for hemolysin